jgi:hypothetical protein
MVAFGMCDLSTCFPVLPPIHLQQRMDWLSILPERLNFCSLDIFNESESARIVVRQQQLPQQQQSLPKPQSPQQQLSPQVSWPLPFFDPHHSTEENYRDDQGSLVGRYASIRKELDYSYHNIYSQERQLLQDSILSAMLERTQQLPCTDHVDEGVAVVAQSPATEQTSWVVFTAGVMGKDFAPLLCHEFVLCRPNTAAIPRCREDSYYQMAGRHERLSPTILCVGRS